jgi:hypothetical protein
LIQTEASVAKQIVFFADEVDEAQLVEAIAAEGAVFLPSWYPEWPLPLLRPPLPAPTESHMAHVVVWHPEIFREDEMLLEDNRLRSAAGFYLAKLWPVLQLWRPQPVNPPMNQGNLKCDARYTSFRVGRDCRTFSPAEVQDFTARAAKLERLYRRICSWVRRRFLHLGRGGFCGPSVSPRIPAARHSTLPGKK